ncbi:MAG: DUF885 domain-containing protein [Nocardioidaceae bacterium]
MTTDQVRPVDHVADQFVADYAVLDPLAATYFGIRGYDDQVTDISPDGFAARRQLTSDARARMAATEPTDQREAVAKASFLERQDVALARYDAGTPQSQVSIITSELHRVRSVFDLMRTDDEDAWRTIDARLSKIPGAIDDYRTTLTRAADAGHVSAKRQLRALAQQVRTWTGQEGRAGSFFDDFVARADGLPASLRQQLDEHAASSTAAFALFERFLTDELLPRGRDKDAVGRDAYGPESRLFLGATIDLEETYAWAWDELKRIDDEMVRVAQQIKSGASVDEAVEILDADPARSIDGKEAFREWMQQLADETIAELADTHFDIPEPVRRIECCLAPTNDGGIYYTGPSEDFERPGRMWWAVPDEQTRFSTWREVTTVYHEGAPGHHLQVAQTAYRSDLLNRWQRTMCWVSGHGEGWALYAERLMDELGYLDDPGDKLGMLDAQGMRAARVILDIGVHAELEIPGDNPFGFHPGEAWTAELCLEFLRQHCRMEEAIISFEVNRYLGWPGQAPSYKVGERVWLQARDEVRRRKGAGFDLAAFHRQALDLGSLGLDPMRTLLAQL